MDVIIELPKMNDLKRVNELAVQVHEMHVGWNPDLFKSVKEVFNKENFKTRIENKELFVAKLKDEVVGYILFNISEKDNPIMKYRKQLSIEAICVDEKCRREGIGTALLEYVNKLGKENGCTHLYLTVNKENENAIKVYEEFGFNVKNIAYIMKL